MKISMMMTLLFASMAGCSSGSLDSGSVTHNDTDNPGQVSSDSCRWPDGVVAGTDASTVGCFARPTFEICAKPVPGEPNCSDACTSSQYALTCDQTSPPPALNCQAIAIPTPNDVLFYCCPCS
jgi:hypothetical protein